MSIVWLTFWRYWGTGVILRDLRHSKHLTIREVEHATGISRGTLSKIERGLEVPSVEQLTKLSQLYDVGPARYWVARIQYILEEEHTYERNRTRCEVSAL